MSIPAPNPQTFEWIKGALDGSMNAVMTEVTQAEKESDYARLTAVPGNLHQIHGSLKMVELDAAGMLAEDLENLCLQICESAGTESDEQQVRIRVLRRGLDSLQGYIDSISRQTPVSPLSLVDQINQVRNLIGGQSISKFELFDPPLGRLSFDGHNGEKSPALAGTKKPVPDDLRVRLVTQLRRKYRRALLSWLANRNKQDASGEYLETINDLLQHLFRISSLDISQQLWWVASGFVDAVASGDIDADKRIKSQFARLDLEISRLEQESIAGIATDPPDELLRQLLFFLGPIKDSHSDRIKQIQDSLELRQWFGTDSGEHEILSEITAKLASIRSYFGEPEFDQIEAAVSEFFTGASLPSKESEQSSLEAVFEDLIESAEKVQLEPMSRLVKQLARTSSEIEKSADALIATAADIKIASALLFLRNSVTHAEAIDATWEHSINSYVEELQALSTQSEKSKDRAIRIKKVAEIEYHHARSAASGEIKEVLAQVEDALSRFESDEDEIEIDKLESASEQLYQIASIFQVAEYKIASKLCKRIANTISGVTNGERNLDRSIVEQIAYAIAATGAAADHLAGRGPGAERALKTAVKLLKRTVRSHAEVAEQAVQEDDDALENSRQAFRVLVDKLEQHRQLLKADSPESIERLSDVFVVLESETDLESAAFIAKLAELGRSMCSSLLEGKSSLNRDHEEFFEQLENELKSLSVPGADVDLDHWHRRHDALIFENDVEQNIDRAPESDVNESGESIEAFIDNDLEYSSTGEAEDNSETGESLDLPETLPVIDLQAELAALSASLQDDSSEDEFQSSMDMEIELDEDAVAFTPDMDAVNARPLFDQEDDSEFLDLESDDEGFHQLEEPEEANELQSLASEEVVDTPERELREHEQEGEMLVQLDQDLKSIFVSEFSSHLERLDTDIKRLSDHAEDTATLNEILLDVEECIHTLAGNCRNLRFDEAAECAESGIERLRQEFGSAYEDESISHFEQGILLLRQALDQIREYGKYDKDLAGALLAFHFSSKQTLEREGEAQLESIEFPEIDPELIDAAKAVSTLNSVTESSEEVESMEASEPADSVLDSESKSESKSKESEDVSDQVYGAEDEDIDEEIRQIFMEESEGILSRINNHLIEWREQGLTPSVLAGIRREFHTLKGSAAATGFDDISGLSHSVETLLDRSGPDSDKDDGVILNLLEEMHDGLAADLGIMSSGSKGHLPTLHRMVSELISPQTDKGESDSKEEEMDEVLEQEPKSDLADDSESYDIGVAERSQAQQTESSSMQQLGGVEPQEGNPETHFEAAEKLESWMPKQVELGGQGGPGADESGVAASLKIDNNKLAELINASGELSLVRTQLQNTLDATRMDLDVLRASMSSMRAGLRELELEADAQIKARPEQQQAVNVDEDFDPLQLDRYSRLQAKSREVTEMLDQLAKVERDLGNRTSNFGGVLQQQSHLGDQLQSGLMSARMVSVGESLPRLRYLVRETSKQSGKNIEFEFHGGDIAVDRQVIETMMAPFEHMIRNAVIHGIESADERTKQGKNESGHISLSLVQQGSELVVDFSDDGRGLDIDKLSARAVELGLVKEQKDVSDVDLLQVITQPGYSTSDSLSMESGRGVGMDVVYQAVRDLGGSMLLSNRPGHGVTFQFRLPVSLAVTQALLVLVANWKFAIQSRTIERLMRVPVNEIYEQNNRRMVVVDDLKLPLFSIRERLGEPPFPGKRNYVSVVLVRLADRLAAFEVDQFDDSVNIVSKMPGKQLDSIPEIAGVTVLGDSSVVLILDPESFIDRIAPVQDVIGISHGLDHAPSLRRVLVVDDSLVVRKVMQKDLEADGLEVETAVDGLNALEVLDRSSFDVALVDIEMPRMNGYELLEKLRQHSRCSDLPVIIITSRSGSQHKKRAVELGADGYITKPYDISALDQLMRQVVDNKRKLH